MVRSNNPFFIVDFETSSVPTNSLLSMEFMRKGEGFEAIAEEGFIFDQIHDIELDFLMLSSASYFEVEPLIVTLGIDIVLKNQVIGLDHVLTVVVPKYMQ